MNIPQDWSGLSKAQINILLINLLFNLKKYSVQEEADDRFSDGCFRINNTVTIKSRWKEKTVNYGVCDDSYGVRFYTGLAYTSDGYSINGKSFPRDATLPAMLYRKCAKRCK